MVRGGLGRLAASLEKYVGPALFVAGDTVAAEAVRSITDGSAGGQNGGKHQHVRSLPGQPPNEEFGDLRRGIETIQVAPLKVEVNSTAAHSIPLEFGTSKMAARPFMGPAAARTRGEVARIVAAGVDRAIKESGK